MNKETWYQIEWWCPPENAISSAGYWTPLEDGRFTDYTKARKAFVKANDVFDPSTIRLVSITKTVVEEN